MYVEITHLKAKIYVEIAFVAEISKSQEIQEKPDVKKNYHMALFVMDVEPLPADEPVSARPHRRERHVAVACPLPQTRLRRQQEHGPPLARRAEVPGDA